jgi:hypothetical protein
MRQHIVTVATSVDHIEISWNARQELVNRLRRLDGGKSIVDAFEAAGTTRPVKLARLNDKHLLLTVIEAWGNEIGYDAFPQGIFALRNALHDDLDLAHTEPA